MASMNGKRLAAVAALTTSLMVMGGAAFASPATVSAGNGDKTTSLLPGPIAKAIETVRNTEGDAHNQISQLPKTSVAKVIETVRNTEGDVANQISQLPKTR